MPLKMNKREIEIEREIGRRSIQSLTRAEALVPGAGRDAIEPLIWDASAAVSRTDVQNDRVVLDGMLSCQAVYRQGEENSLRALTAKATLSQAVDLPGARPGMLCRSLVQVENVEPRYENGHMVFLVSLGIAARVSCLEKIEVIESLEDAENVQTRYRELCPVKLAAEASETAVLTARVELPGSLDPRAVLMDWGSVSIESAEPDLGGIRVKGKVQAETLIASGIEGRPAAALKYPIEFDKLIELPEWLCRDACVQPCIRSIRSQLEAGDEERDGALSIQADVRFDIAANLKECVQALQDAYATGGVGIRLEEQEIGLISDVCCCQAGELVRGTVPLAEGMSVASIIAVRVLPVIAEVEDGDRGSRISGLLDAGILCMPNGSDQPCAVRTSLPFSIETRQRLEESDLIRIAVASAEANALMSDRLEMKIALQLFCESRSSDEVRLVRNIEEGEGVLKKPGYVIYWPENGDDAWSIGRRYAISEKQVQECAGEGRISAGKPLVLRI